MQTKKSCSIFSDNTDIFESKLIDNLTIFFETLIVKDDIDIFYFAGTTSFHKVCYEILTQLKQKYTFIKRIFKLDNDDIVPIWIEGLEYGENLSVKNCNQKIDMMNESDFEIFYISNKKSYEYSLLNFAKRNKKDYLNFAEK